MKKILTLVLALLLLLLAACGGSTNTPSTGSHAGTFSGTDASSQSAPPTTQAVQTEPSTEPSTQPPTESGEKDPALGVYDPDTFVYTNDFLGLRCQLDNAWTVYDEEQLAQVNGLTAELLEDTELGDLIANSPTAQIFYAAENDGLVTVNIVLENLGLLYGVLLDESAYMERSKEQVAPALEAVGLENVTIEASTVTFAGKELPALAVAATFSDVSFYEKMTCLKVGNYMAVITAASYVEDVTQDVLDLFAPAV